MFTYYYTNSLILCKVIIGLPEWRTTHTVYNNGSIIWSLVLLAICCYTHRTHQDLRRLNLSLLKRSKLLLQTMFSKLGAML